MHNPAVLKPAVEEKQSNEGKKDYRDSRVSTLVKMKLNMSAGSSSSNASARVN